MAASEETCAGNPNFAIICSFITNFGNDCGVDISIPYLQEMLEDTKTVHQDLLEILLHLMRRGKKRVNKDKWEKCLIKFCHEYSSVDAWEIERFGFLKSKLSVKLELLKRLLELQFDANAKFKTEVNKHDAAKLRLLPIGRDIDGQAYWYQLDKDHNMRLYREIMGEESSWQLLCSTTADLKTLIASLEKQYSCPGADSCEDKLDEPKSPSSDMPVPKKEQDCEEMTSCLSESKPCTIIIKTEKKELPDTSVKSESCANVDSTENDNSVSNNVTKGSVKLKLKLEPSSNSKNEQNSSKPFPEYSIVSDKCAIGATETEPTEMDIDKTPEITKSVVNNDIEMKDVENNSTKDTDSPNEAQTNLPNKEHSDQNIPTSNANTDADIEKSDSVNHKSSKIKLYEKWSNERKKLDAVKTDAKESSFSSNDVIESKKQSESLTVNKITEPAIPAKVIPEHAINDQKSSLDNQNLSPDPDIAVDLSKSSRVNVIVQNTNSKPLCSTDAISLTKSSTENGVSNSDFNSNNLKPVKHFELPTEKSSEKATDLKKRLLDSSHEKRFGRSHLLSGYYETSGMSNASSTSGLSHLQALQNMCETNSMGGLHGFGYGGVIQSTNRLKNESTTLTMKPNAHVKNDILSPQDSSPDIKCLNSSIEEVRSESIKEFTKNMDYYMPSSNTTEFQKSSNDQKMDSLLPSAKKSCDALESVYKDGERKFSVFSKPSSKVDDPVLFESKLKTLSEIKVSEEIGSESKDSLGEPPDLKESFSSLNQMSEEYKISSLSNESEVSEPPLLLKADLKTPVKVDDQSVLVEKSKKDNVKDKISIKECSSNAEGKKQKTSDISDIIKTSDVDKDKCLAQCKSDDKDDKIVNEAITEKKVIKSDDLELKSQEIEDSTKSNEEKSKKSLNNESGDRDIDTSKGKASESALTTLSEKNKELEKESLTKTDHDEKEANKKSLINADHDKKDDKSKSCKEKKEDKSKSCSEEKDDKSKICNEEKDDKSKSCSEEKDDKSKICNEEKDDKSKSCKEKQDDKSKSCNKEKDDKSKICNEEKDDKSKSCKEKKDDKSKSCNEEKDDKSKICSEEKDDKSKSCKEKKDDKSKSCNEEKDDKSKICKEKKDDKSKSCNKKKDDKNKSFKEKKDSEVPAEEAKKNNVESDCYEDNPPELEKKCDSTKEDCTEPDLKESSERVDTKDCSTKVDVEKQKASDISDFIKISDCDKDKSIVQCHSGDKEDKIVHEAVTKQKSTKSEDSESKAQEIEDSTKSKEEKSETNLNDKSNDCDGDTSKGQASEIDLTNLSERNKELEKDSSIKSDPDKKETENKSLTNDYDKKEDKKKSYKKKKDNAVPGEKAKKIKVESDCCEDNPPELEKKCDTTTKDDCTKPDLKDSSESIVVEKTKEETEDTDQSLEHSVNEVDASKSVKEKLDATPSLKEDVSADSEKNVLSLDEINAEDSSKKLDEQNDEKQESNTNSKRKGKVGRPSKKTPARRNTRRSKISHEEIEVDPPVDETSKEESKECSISSLNTEDSSSNKEIKMPLKTPESPKSAINSENTEEKQFRKYSLRHSTCLESKFKHPVCDKYAKSPVPVICIDISSEKVTKSRQKGKNAKQPVSKKSQQPAAKPTTPAKKTPPPPPPTSSKKKPPKSQKKIEIPKTDFSIPEGFLEILDKESSAKKRKGGDLKTPIDSQNNSDDESMPRKRSRRIQEQHQKKMTELAVEMEREQRILEQLAKRSNKKNNKSTPQKTPEKSNVKGSSAKSTPTKAANTPTKSVNTPAKSSAKSPRTPKVPTIIAEEETLMEGRRTRKMNSRSKNLTKMTLMYEDESKDSSFSTSRETEKSKKKRRRKRHRKGFKPWDLSSESSSSIEVFTEEEEEEEPDEPLIFEVNEDEFACEEVDPNAEPVVIRRARTAKKIEIQDAEEECINDDTPCEKCGKYDKPEWILLCDKCDKGYHTHCLIPPLMIVPDGDWFCQPCEHLSLCQCLHEELSKLEVILKQKEREALRKQRLAYVGISLDNVLKPEKKEKSDESDKEEKEEEEEKLEEEKIKEKENSRASRTKQSSVEDDERNEKLFGKRSVRARRNVNYRFKEYDELIFSALQEDMVEVPEEFKEEVESEAGSDKAFKAQIPKRKRRARRFNDFGSSEDEDSEDDYQGGSSDSEATAPPSSVTEQESGSGEEWRISKSSGGKRKSSHRKPQSRRRRKQRGRGDSSEEDWDDEELEAEPYRPTTRRAAQKAVSYRELSSEEEDEWGVKKRQMSTKRRKGSSSDSEGSFKKKVSKKKRVRRWGSSETSEESEEKSMSSSGESEEEEEEEEDDNEEDSENEMKSEKKEPPKEKLIVKKNVLKSDEDDEEEATAKEPAPKKKVRKVVSESEEEEEEDEEEEEEEEDEEEEEEDEEDEEESESEEESDADERTIKKKIPIPEEKIPNINAKVNITVSKQDAEKKDIPENLSKVEDRSNSVDKKESLLNAEKKEFTPKVLVKKELSSVNVPVEQSKPVITITPVSDKAHPKTIRNDGTKMVPCVIPYEKPQKIVQASIPDEADKYSSKDEETPRPAMYNRPPIQIPKQGAVYAPPPGSRIKYSGALPRHTIPPVSSPMRHSMPASNLQPRMPLPTNLSIRPSPSSVVVQHSSISSRMPLRPSVPINKPTAALSAAPITPPSKQTSSSKETKPYKSTIMEPFSNMDDENESDDEVPLERIPTAVPVPPQNRPVSYEKDAEYRPAAKEIPPYSYAPPEEKQYSGSYSTLSNFQDYSARPSPLKPSLVETYPNNSSPSKLTPLDSYSRTNSPKGFISLDSYSENKKKKHFYGNSSQDGEASHRPPPPSSENYQGGEIRFPPEPYPCPQSPNSFSNRSPPPPPNPTQRDSGTPPRLYSQFPDAYAPPRSPEYYQNHQYYASEERIPRPSYQPNYVPPEPPSFVSNPYVATPVPQPNGGFMIDTLLQARNHENEDELTGVTDIVSYITQE